MEKIKAFIVNRNLLTTLKNTVDFLLKEPRVEVVIFDQVSTYPPLLEYYNNTSVTVVYAKQNGGPNSVWGEDLKPHFNKQHYIIADSDCTYDGIPEDWLDKMLFVLNSTSIYKVGFSIEINDLPDTEITRQVINWERKYWTKRTNEGWEADIDSTFNMYRPHASFAYQAIRLDRPYCMRHAPWYITEDNITEEWLYYINNTEGFSTWGNRIKDMLKLKKPL